MIPSAVPARAECPAEEFERILASVTHCGRWGADDFRGTLNLISPASVAAAAALVRTGHTISLAHDLDTSPGVDNPRPAEHRMTAFALDQSGEPRVNTDYVGTDFHGKSVTHLDALSHCVFRGRIFNGAGPAQTISSAGASVASVLDAADGIVGRGVLVDVPGSRGIAWLEPGRSITADDLRATLDSQGEQLQAGDLVFVRTGARRRRAAHGPWDQHRLSAGLHPNAMELFHETDVALLGSDADSDARPSTVPSIESPIHAVALTAMGMPLVDNAALEDLATACAHDHRHAFLCVIAPLRIPGGTGSPINPIAML